MLCLFISYGRSHLIVFGGKPPEAIKPSMLYRNIKPLVVEAVQVKEAVDVPTNGGVLHAKRGDWLIRDAQGNLTRCDDADFKCTFESLETSRGLEEFVEAKSWGC